MDVFQCLDRDNVTIICTEDTWENHILAEHPEMGGCEAYVKTAIEKPYQLYQDGRHPNIRIVYKPFILPKPYNLNYLRVAIKYRKKTFGKLRGYFDMGRIVGQTNFEIDFSTIKKSENFIQIYHDDEDTFFLRGEEARPAVSFDWNGDVWLRVDPSNGEIVGFEIDDFESVFLKKHPELANAWNEMKPLCRRRKTVHEETSWEAFLRIMLEFLRDLLKGQPQQTEFAV